MPRKEIEDITRIHMHIYCDDKLILEQLFSDNIGVSSAIRKIIRSWIDNNNLKISDNQKEVIIFNNLLG